MKNEIISFIKSLYKDEHPVALHRPVFKGNEYKYIKECIDSTFVSYVGQYVNKFEEKIAEFTGAKYAVAVVNGTCALHVSLKLVGVNPGDEVLTQALTFVATPNAISYCGAKPVFIDSNKENLGMSMEKLAEFLQSETIIKEDGNCYNKKTNNKISACVPVHIFGHPLEITKIKEICDKYKIVIVEDAAESLGSYYKEKHTGTFSKVGILSFNGNKIITTGGGGMIITDDENLAKQAKHITTTAKLPHKWEFVHDVIGYNYRLTNVSAAIGCAQMESLPTYLENKRELAYLYKDFFNNIGIEFIFEPKDCRSNFWLNAIVLNNRKERDEFLEFSNNNGVMTRPIWKLMNKLVMYKDCQTSDLSSAQWLEDRVVNIPSSVRS